MACSSAASRCSGRSSSWLRGEERGRRPIAYFLAAARDLGARLRQCAGPREGRVGEHACRPLSVIVVTLLALVATWIGFSGLQRERRDEARGSSIGVIAALAFSACGSDPEPPQYGANPQLPEPQRGLLPSMKIAKPANGATQRRPCRRDTRSQPSPPISGFRARRWCCPTATSWSPKGEAAARRAAPQGRHRRLSSRPRARARVEGRRPADPAARRATATAPMKCRRVFADNLNAPYGLALVDGALYVANQDALVRFDYRDGQTAGQRTADADHGPAVGDQPSLDQGAGRQPGRPLPLCRHRLQQQHHRARHGWPRSTGRWCGRSMPQTGAHRPYATGLRNPTALAIQPGTGQLWAVVNERDEIGPEPRPRLPDLGARRRLLRLALQLLGPERGPARATAGSAEGRLGDPPGLQPGIARRRARPGLLHAGDGRAISPTACSSASMAAGTAACRSATRWSSCRSATGAPPAPVDFVTGFLGDGRQDSRPAGRRNGRSARRADRRRRSVEHDLENHSRPVPSGCGAEPPRTHHPGDARSQGRMRMIPPENEHDDHDKGRTTD